MKSPVSKKTTQSISWNIGLLVTGADAYEENAEGMFTAFDRIVDFLLARKSGGLNVGDCTVPVELPEEVKNKA